eukprot:TRINITY_DN11432_c0_g1_i3.p1 TRINITY_DN11432_c0_g1~~TRINITY_DN11432_c0_g1_i3.p1  ORF type:complete len:887 (-),score=188.51 TRINITY_DN11432_c0_g1_i3:1482-4142(-)
MPRRASSCSAVERLLAKQRALAEFHGWLPEQRCAAAKQEAAPEQRSTDTSGRRQPEPRHAPATQEASSEHRLPDASARRQPERRYAPAAQETSLEHKLPETSSGKKQPGRRCAPATQEAALDYRLPDASARRLPERRYAPAAREAVPNHWSPETSGWRQHERRYASAAGASPAEYYAAEASGRQQHQWRYTSAADVHAAGHLPAQKSDKRQIRRRSSATEHPAAESWAAETFGRRPTQRRSPAGDGPAAEPCAPDTYGSGAPASALSFATLQLEKSYKVLSELIWSTSGSPLFAALAERHQGFRFLDLGAAPGGFSGALLDQHACAWGVGVTLPPAVGFPMLAGGDACRAGRYSVHYADLLDVGPSFLAHALHGERVDLCVCDGQDMRKKHGSVAPAGGFAGALGQRYCNPLAHQAETGLGIWALLLHEIGLSLSQLDEYGCLIFRFSWVLSVYDEEVRDCDRGYFEATMRMFDVLAESFRAVDVFKSELYHAADSTCYVLCSGLSRSRLEAIFSASGGAARIFARSALEALEVDDISSLPRLSCLQALPSPSAERVVEIQSLLEKVTVLRELARCARGLATGDRFAKVANAKAVKIGKAIGPRLPAPTPAATRMNGSAPFLHSAAASACAAGALPSAALSAGTSDACGMSRLSANGAGAGAPPAANAVGAKIGGDAFGQAGVPTSATTASGDGAAKIGGDALGQTAAPTSATTASGDGAAKIGGDAFGQAGVPTSATTASGDGAAKIGGDALGQHVAPTSATTVVGDGARVSQSEKSDVPAAPSPTLGADRRQAPMRRRSQGRPPASPDVPAGARKASFGSRDDSIVASGSSKPRSSRRRSSRSSGEGISFLHLMLALILAVGGTFVLRSQDVWGSFPMTTYLRS